MNFVSPLTVSYLKPSNPMQPLRRGRIAGGDRRLRTSVNGKRSRCRVVHDLTACKDNGSSATKFCRHCAGRMEWRRPSGDERVRSICIECNTIVYENPKVVVGCVPISIDKKRVLLVKRSIEPVGKWTVTAGFLETGEKAQAGAAREALEEAGAEVSMHPISLLAVYDILPAKQIQLLYRSTLLNEESIGPGQECSEAKMFAWSDIPWENLAFPTVQWALEYSIETLNQNAAPPQIKSR